MRVIIFFTFFTDIKKVHPNIHEEILAEQNAVKMKKEAFCLEEKLVEHV